MGVPGCPRCDREVGADPLGWRCALHGLVEPLGSAVEYGPRAIGALLAAGGVPAWVPWPLPLDWAVVGLRWTGAEGQRARAVAVALSGPGLLGGAADLVVVAEEPGVGLGARFAGLTGPDPGAALASLPHDAKIHADGRPTPVWCVPGGEDRAAYVGEALGRWLWLVLWPAAEGMLVHDDLQLVDLLDPALAYEVPGAGLSGPLLT